MAQITFKLSTTKEISNVKSDHKCDVTVRSYVRMTGQMLQLASFFSLMGRIWYSYELNLVVRKNIQIIYRKIPDIVAWDYIQSEPFWREL